MPRSSRGAAFLFALQHFLQLSLMMSFVPIMLTSLRTADLASTPAGGCQRLSRRLFVCR